MAIASVTLDTEHHTESLMLYAVAPSVTVWIPERAESPDGPWIQDTNDEAVLVQWLPAKGRLLLQLLDRGRFPTARVAVVT